MKRGLVQSEGLRQPYTALERLQVVPSSRRLARSGPSVAGKASCWPWRGIRPQGARFPPAVPPCPANAKERSSDPDRVRGDSNVRAKAVAALGSERRVGMPIRGGGETSAALLRGASRPRKAGHSDMFEKVLSASFRERWRVGVVALHHRCAGLLDTRGFLAGCRTEARGERGGCCDGRQDPRHLAYLTRPGCMNPQSISMGEESGSRVAARGPDFGSKRERPWARPEDEV